MRNWWIRGEAAHLQPFRHAFRRVGRPSAVLVEESPRSLTLPLLLRYARKQGAGRVLWGHFSSNHRTDSRRSPADRYRIALARSVEACACYTPSIKAFLQAHVDESRLFVANNTLDTGVLFSLREALHKEGRSAVKQRLGLADRHPVLLFLGRLVPAKGTDQLVEILRQLPPTACLVVIGSGPAERQLRASAADSLPREIRFLGAIPEYDRTAPYLYAADVLLNPGYLGLNVNHAFSFGLPVVSRRSPKAGIRFHSPEVDYLEPGENGELVESPTPEAFAQAVTAVVQDRDRYSGNARTFAEQHLTVDRMIDGLEAAIIHAETSSS